MNFRQFLAESDFSWWQNFVVHYALQPHKIPLAILALALGSTVGAGAGAWRALTKGSLKEIPKGIARWGLGQMTQWAYTPKWAEGVEDLPPEIQQRANELVQLGKQLKASQNNPEEFQKLQTALAAKSQELFHMVEKLPAAAKMQLASMLQS